MINCKANRIPELRSNLPFVQQSRLRTFKKSARLEVSNLEIAHQGILVGHVKDALGNLLSGCRLTTPLWTFYQNSTLASQFIGQ